MNLMGFSADGLGNHNFDKGSAYLRNTLIPLAKFPYMSANVVGANGQTPAQWKPSLSFDIAGGKLGVVGFTNEDAPTLVVPGAFDPFTVAAATGIGPGPGGRASQERTRSSWSWATTARPRARSPTRPARSSISPTS